MLLTPLLLLAAAVPVDFSAYRETAALRASTVNELMTITWTGESQQPLRLRLNLADPEKLIADLAVNGKTILRDAAPAYWVYTGKRRGGWDNFFDTPSMRPNEVREFNATIRTERAKVETLGGQRLRVTLGPLTMGTFHGDLVFTVFSGSNLIHQEAVVSTDEPDTAYYYNTWLTRISTNELSRLHWLDASSGKFRQHKLVSDLDLDYVPLKVHRRTLVAEGDSGSLALFPPPHQYFFPRDETINYANLWYRLYRISPNVKDGDFFSFGIRQTHFYEQAHWAPLVNAPPGSKQRLGMFWYASATPAREAFNKVSAYTHDDRFVAMPGHKALTTHYHLSLTMDWRRRDRQNYQPDFVDMFKYMGINMAHVYDFHTDGHPRNTTKIREDELRDYYHEAQRLSSDDFLLIPGEEANAHFGGHWNLLLPRPLTWFMQRKPEEPFEKGGVYRVGNADEMFRMMQRTGGLAFTAHPRTKGSTGFPDQYKDTPFYRDASFLGGGFKAMPADNASPRLGERGLKLLDDMNNWGQRKFLVGEVDVFKIERNHELYGHMNINYVKLAATPKFPDWSPLLSALKAGEFFVSTGEVLLHDVKLQLAGDEIKGEADIEWTFPLNLLEVVWGDGKETRRETVTLHETGQHGRRKFSLNAKAPGAKWARLAVWDVAANGAFHQPVRFDQ